MTRRFTGFKAGKHAQIALPAQFFSDLLPYMDNMDELQVLLACFRALHQREGDYRYLQQSDLEADQYLQHSFDARPQPTTTPAERLRQALAHATERGALLCATLPDQPDDPLYFMNTMRGRQAVAQIQAGQWRQEGGRFEILPVRPNIYTLYEDNIGPLTPLIAEELKDAQATYPAEWMNEAITLAVEHNKRSWRYIHAILRRWREEGRASSATTSTDQRSNAERYAGGQYADFIES